jgi:proteasome accessory factor B
VDKIERLLSLINALLDAPRAISADDLRTKVPGYPSEDASFKRAFERDKDELREMGVPLLVETIPGSDPPLLGYRVRRVDYELPDPGLLPDELEALNLAAAVTGLSGGVGQRALFKLGAGASESPVAELPADPNLLVAFSGVAERRAIAFRYHGVDREVHPYRLEFNRGRWYLSGFDLVRGEVRWYRLERVEGAVEAVGPAEAFAPPAEAVPGLQLAPWELADGQQAVSAEVWFDPALAPSLRHSLPEGSIQRDEEDGLVVTLEVANREGFRSWVLSFLDRAEVLSPADLRADLIEWLELVAAAEGER